MSRKRILLIATVLALVVVFSLAVAAKLVDGTYSLRGKEDTRGNYPTISVVVKNGKISSVDYKEYNGNAKTFKSKDNYTYEPYFTAIEVLNKKAVEVNGDITKIDAAAGATHSSANFMDILVAAQIKAAKLVDKTYPALETKADSRGNKAKMVITVKGGKIDKIEYYEYNEITGKAKTKGEYKWDAYFEAIEALPKRVLENGGSLLDVDGYAGATATTGNFFALYRQYINILLTVAKM